MSRILVINSNSNPAVTNIVEKGLPGYFGTNDIEIVCVNPEAGPPGVDTQLDIVISALETARIVAMHPDGFDAYIIACGSDPGLDACRSIVAAPVVGISEAGMLMACTLGYKFSIIVNSEVDIPVTEERVRQYGLRERFASARAIDMTTHELKDRRKMMERLVEVGRLAIDMDRAEVILLPGSVQIGMETELAERIGAPVLSGMACALKDGGKPHRHGSKNQPGAQIPPAQQAGSPRRLRRLPGSLFLPRLNILPPVRPVIQAPGRPPCSASPP